MSHLDNNEKSKFLSIQVKQMTESITKFRMEVQASVIDFSLSASVMSGRRRIERSCFQFSNIVKIFENVDRLLHLITRQVIST
ncbi:hypothetical protein ACQ4M3_26260 [Leptolyngbya sp. AN03gr2]|uniref:hypothetical protein n=1 Tax=unclassified Leptolyngbya TaxID=2650499 RepID=UPI003D31BD0D